MRSPICGVTPRSTRRNPLFFFPIAAMLAGLVAVGCKGNGPEPQKSPTPKPTEQATTTTLELQEVDEAGIAKAVERHKGKVVLLDIWATWCGPCVETFPRLPKWLAKYGKDRIAVVTVSLDDPDDVEPKVLPFLREQNTESMDLLLYTAGDHDKMVNSIDPEWAGEVPALFLYDHKGKLAVSLTGEHESSEVEEHITRLLETNHP